MLATNRVLDFCKRHIQAILEVAGLALCYLGARFWFPDLPAIQLAPSLVLLLILIPPARPPATPAINWRIFLRVPVVAGVTYALSFVIADSTEGLGLVLGSWSGLASLGALVVWVRSMWTSRQQMPAGRWPAVLRRLRTPLTSIILPIALAWGGAVALHRTIYPPETRGPSPHRNVYGPVHLKIKLPGTAAGIPEPLIVCGKVGRASLVYLRLLEGNRAKVGIEFWGLDLNQGTEFAVPAADAVIDVVCEMPALFPGENDRDWDKTPPEIRQQHSRRFRITVDGVVRLEGTIQYEQPRHSPLYFGANPLGGSFIAGKFSGTILQARQGK